MHFDAKDPEKIDRMEQIRIHSDDFMAIYGNVAKYSDVYIWLTTPFDESLVPKVTTSFILLAKTDTFSYLRVCQSSHRTADGKGVKGLNKLQFDSAWVRLLFGRFEATSGEEIASSVAAFPGFNSEKDVRGWMKEQLSRLLQMVRISSSSQNLHWTIAHHLRSDLTQKFVHIGWMPKRSMSSPTSKSRYIPT